jgi:predicted outer membrane repeat protein
MNSFQLFQDKNGNFTETYSGLHQGMFYYVMELIEGEPLDRYALNRQLGEHQIVILMQAICRAVHHAHMLGVVHRDLKPDNILVTPDGIPHILDFGLARTFLQVDSDIMLSIEGEVAGTPRFMSPEQAAGHHNKIDMRSDVYSLGVILFYLLTQDWPHVADSGRRELLRKIVEEDARQPSRLNKAIDRDLEAILCKALARDPDLRYLSAGDMGDDLENYLRGEPIMAQPPTVTYLLVKKIRKHRRALAWGFGVVLLYALTLCIGIMYAKGLRKPVPAIIRVLSPWMTWTVSGQNEEPEASGFVEADLDAKVIYVDHDAGGDNNGRGWKDAYRSLQDAISNAQGGEQIWVTEGTYRPQYDEANARSAFHIGKGVSLYGGFVGTEEYRWQRDPNAHTTIFQKCAQGKIKHIIVAHGPFGLDGFTLSRDPNNQVKEPQPPPALVCPPMHELGGILIKNCIFRNLIGNNGSAFHATRWSHIRFVGCQFIDNEVYNDGGVMYLDHCEQVYLDDCVFSGNESGARAGCIFNDHTNNIVIKNSEFSQNKSRLGGGVIYNDHSDAVRISECVFYANQCSQKADGACIVNNHSHRMKVTYCRFESNVSTRNGGAIQFIFSQDHVIEDCTFHDNRASRGGVFAYGPICSGSIVQCTFTKNKTGDPNQRGAGGMGGVIIAGDVMLRIVNCHFSGNESGDAGGVMVLGSGSSVTLIQCVFNQNYAFNNGGVIATDNVESLAVHNCTFFGNIAHRRNAGGIFIEINERRVPREQIVPFQSEVLLCNSIFWDNEDNEANGRQPHLTVRGETVNVEILACCMQSWDETIPGADVIDQDPLFVDPNGDNETPGDDFMLKSGSPCIDAGIAFNMTDIKNDENFNDMILWDLAGNPRINNGRVDLGPYEYHESGR